jgi:uncharacterized protein (DUF1684 family)
MFTERQHLVGLAYFDNQIAWRIFASGETCLGIK